MQKVSQAVISLNKLVLYCSIIKRIVVDYFFVLNKLCGFNIIGVSSTGKIGEPFPGASTEEDADIMGPVPEEDEDDDDHAKAKLEYVVLSDIVKTLTFLAQTYWHTFLTANPVSGCQSFNLRNKKRLQLLFKAQKVYLNFFF